MEINRDEWSTPDWFFGLIKSEFDPQRDVCASAHNKMCNDYFGLDNNKNAFYRDWFADGVSVCWMNPPYSDPAPWVCRAANETRRPGCRVVALLKHDHGTKWWKEYVEPFTSEIRMISPRIQFVPPVGWTPKPRKDGTVPERSTSNIINVLVVFEKRVTGVHRTFWDVSSCMNLDKSKKKGFLRSLERKGYNFKDIDVDQNEFDLLTGKRFTDE